MRQVFCCVLTLLSLLPTTPGVAQGGNTPLPVWKPDAAHAALLGPEVRLDHCAFQPPQGFKLGRTETFASGRKLYTFSGKPHFISTTEPGFAPTILITTETDGTAPPDWTVAEGVSALVTEYATKMINGDFDKLTAPEIGLVGGRAALRRYAKGDWDLDTRLDQFPLGAQNTLHRVVPVRLLAYGIGSSREGTLVLAYDLARDSQTTLPLIEASLLTLRQTDPPPTASQSAAPPPSPGVWQPRPDLLRFLGPEVTTHALTLRVPAGYQPVLMKFTGKGGADTPIVFGWKAPGTDLLPMLRVTAVPLPQGQAPPALANVLAGLADDEGQGLTKYVHSKPEFGQTGFGPTGRFYGAGTIKFIGESSPKTLAVYAFLTRKYLVTIEAISAAQDSVPEIHVIEAAILTGHPSLP